MSEPKNTNPCPCDENSIPTGDCPQRCHLRKCKEQCCFLQDATFCQTTAEFQAECEKEETEE